MVAAMNGLTLSKVAFGAYAEPKKQAEAMRNKSFKIALVASDCLLLGKLTQCSCSSTLCQWPDIQRHMQQQVPIQQLYLCTGAGQLCCGSYRVPASAAERPSTNQHIYMCSYAELLPPLC
eukprot:GHUV01045455.1.p2 GENE.GHUV01045455.1~~GHUV01045455.1.p2  ORF type:complete len:120 (+),score=33.43 GHUV01045455.1:558-917(+)